MVDKQYIDKLFEESEKKNTKQNILRFFNALGIVILFLVLTIVADKISLNQMLLSLFGMYINFKVFIRR